MGALCLKFSTSKYLFKFSFLYILYHRCIFRTSHQRCSIKQAVLKNFVIFAGKHQCWSLFLIKLQTWRSATFQKETPKKVFSCQFSRFLRTYILKNIYKRLLLYLEPYKTFLIESFCVNSQRLASNYFCKEIPQ